MFVFTVSVNYQSEESWHRHGWTTKKNQFYLAIRPIFHILSIHLFCFRWFIDKHEIYKTNKHIYNMYKWKSETLIRRNG